MEPVADAPQESMADSSAVSLPVGSIGDEHFIEVIPDEAMTSLSFDLR